MRQGIYHHPHFTQEETGLRKLGHCPRLQSQGALSQDVQLGSPITPCCVCHYQPLLICSNAFLKLPVRLNIFSMCLLTICISSSCGSVSDVRLAPASQGLREHKQSKYLPKARQALLRAHISYGGNSRLLG